MSVSFCIVGSKYPERLPKEISYILGSKIILHMKGGRKEMGIFLEGDLFLPSNIQTVLQT